VLARTPPDQFSCLQPLAPGPVHEHSQPVSQRRAGVTVDWSCIWAVGEGAQPLHHACDLQLGVDVRTSMCQWPALQLCGCLCPPECCYLAAVNMVGVYNGGNVLHVDMFAHNKSGVAYQDRNQRPETAGNHRREFLQQPRLLLSRTA
jgi:hypothetical protein